MSTAAWPASPRLVVVPLHPPLPPKHPSTAPTRRGVLRLRLAAARRETPPPPAPPAADADAVDCVGTGTDVECFVDPDAGTNPLLARPPEAESGEEGENEAASAALMGREWWEWGSLLSPFFFWGTAMVAMKGVIPKTGPFFVAALRLLPAGALLVAFAAARGRKQPSGWAAWAAVAAFGLVDAACFQGFLAEGLQKTSAGLGSVIIDSQPLTVAILAALLFGESIGAIGVGGLVLGVIGLLLLEVCLLSMCILTFRMQCRVYQS